jgi:hypothetical protein
LQSTKRAPTSVASAISASRHSNFSSTPAAPVPSLRTARKQRARGIASTPVVELEGESPSHAATDDTIIHEYPEEHEFVPGDLGELYTCLSHRRRDSFF